MKTINPSKMDESGVNHALHGSRRCGFCHRPIGVMARFFQDQRKPWCVDCWLHGPANPAGQPEPDTRTGKLF